MNLEDYRTIFVVGTLALVLIVAAPTLALVVPLPSGSERFSEFWLLGPSHMAEDYPFNVRVNESQSVFVGIGNHMGESMYYAVYVKLRNETQPLPDVTITQSSPLALLYQFRAFVIDGGSWEAPLIFRISNVSLHGNTMSLNRITINNETYNVSAFSKWDSEHSGFYYQLFLELWLYNEMSQSFQYHKRFVGIWLNMTGS